MCFTRPVRNEEQRARRRYSSSDLRRIFRYVARDEGIENAVCAVAAESGLQRFARDNVDAMRDLPCASSGLLDILPERAIRGIEGVIKESITGDESFFCDEDSLALNKLGAIIVFVGFVAWLLQTIISNRVLAFFLRRLFLFIVIQQFIDRMGETIEALVKFKAWTKATEAGIQVLACQRDDNGELLKFEDVLDIPQSLKDFIDEKR